MIQNYISKSSFRFLLSRFIILILVACATIKVLYPLQIFKGFYLAVSLFEIVLAIGLCWWWNRWEVWAFLALVFASWAGYSLYMAIFGLPCSCMGAAWSPPRGVSLVINVLIIAGSWAVLRGFPRFKKKVILTFLSIVSLIVGYLVALLFYS